MLRLYIFELQAQGFEQGIGEHCDAVIAAFAIADDDLVILEIEIFDAQAQAFHEAQAAAIHDLGHEAIDATRFLNDSEGFGFGKHGGDLFGFGWTYSRQRGFIQFYIEYMPV